MCSTGSPVWSDGLEGWDGGGEGREGGEACIMMANLHCWMAEDNTTLLKNFFNIFKFIQNFPQFIVIHTVKGFGIVNKAEIDVFLELSCFFYDPANVGNLISGSFAFTKSSLNIWKFMVHILLMPGFEDSEH